MRSRQAKRAELADQLHSAAIHLLRQLRKEDDASGLSAPRLSALSVVVFAGPVTLGQLARAEQVRPPTMTKIVTGLEKDKLVERKPDPNDRRLTKIVATPKGQRILIEGRARRVKSLTDAVDQLNENELAHLDRGIQVFRKLIAATATKTPSNAKPESDFDALRDDLRHVYDGDPWHGSSITAVLKEIDAEMAARRTIPNVHTIWELVLHMTGWTREVASRVRGADAKDVAEDWPHQPKNPTEKDWHAAQDALRAAHQDLMKAVDGLKLADLVRMVGDQRNPSAGTGKTVGSHIRGILQHHTYHQGQIAQLKKAASSQS